MKLSNVKILKAKPKTKQYKISDGEMLYLLIQPNGKKLWKLDYCLYGKRKTYLIGNYPSTSLMDARIEKAKLKDTVRKGIDPNNQKKLNKIKEATYTNNDTTFKSVAKSWLEATSHKWTPNHKISIARRRARNIYPYLGNTKISNIKPSDLLAVIRMIEERGAYETAKKSLITCGQIFRYGVVLGMCETDITYNFRGLLKTRKVQHMARIEEKELPSFFEKLEKYHGEAQTQLAIKIIISTMVRTSELRLAKIEELDFENAEWRIPAERMKMKTQHIIPLTKDVVSLFKKLISMNSELESDWLFPQQRNPRKPMSENAMLYALYRMGYHSRATIHGFRGTASTILNEREFNRDVIEAQLAHQENSVRAAYNGAQYLKQRREMLEWWSNFLKENGINS